MKRFRVLLIILVVVVGGGSFYLFYYAPKIRHLKEEEGKELMLTLPREVRFYFEECKIEVIQKWKITSKDTGNKRVCVWTTKFINISLDSIYYLIEYNFILKDSNEITIATDPFFFDWCPLEPGKYWEAHGTILLSEVEAQMVYSSCAALSIRRGKLADKEIREKRKKEFLQELKDIENETTKEGLYKDASRCYEITCKFHSLYITAENTQWEDKIDSLKNIFYINRAKQSGEIFSDSIYIEIDLQKRWFGYSDKKIWEKVIKNHPEYKKAKASGMEDKEIQKCLGLIVE